MKKILLLILTFTTTAIAAQEFAPVGATWHYSQATANTEIIAYKTIQSFADTVIEGKTCRKLLEISRYSLTPDTSFVYVYSSNDSVFFFRENNFHLLYSFGAQVGDTVTLGYYTTYEGLPLKMIIDSTSLIDINGQFKKQQYVRCGDGISVEFGGYIIEGIGNVNFMFPLADSYTDGPLRCYEDSNNGLFISPYHSNNGWDFQHCEQIITGMNETEFHNSLQIFPNPAHSSITLTHINRLTDYAILDLTGRILKQGNTQTSSRISIDDLANGIYLVSLFNNRDTAILKLVKE